MSILSQMNTLNLRKVPQSDPVVACLMATNRRERWGHAYEQYVKQTYGPAQLLMDDGPGTHGHKMDCLFRQALASLEHFAEFLVIHDDDDDYAKDRISRLIEPMLDHPTIECVGTSLVYYVDERNGKAWLYDNQKLMEGWKANTSLFWLAAPAYRRSAYQEYGPWDDGKCGADLRFLHRIPREHVLDLRDSSLMVCHIHANNAAPKEPHGVAWTEVPMNEVPKL